MVLPLYGTSERDCVTDFNQIKIFEITNTFNEAKNDLFNNEGIFQYYTVNTKEGKDG